MFNINLGCHLIYIIYIQYIILYDSLYIFVISGRHVDEERDAFHLKSNDYENKRYHVNNDNFVSYTLNYQMVCPHKYENNNKLIKINNNDQQ